jgi:hypothetical protein
VDLDDTFENVMGNTHLDNSMSLSPGEQTKNDITLLSLSGMMSTSRANIDETFVIGRRHYNSRDGGGGMGGGDGGCDRGGGNLRLLGGTCNVGPDGVLLMPGMMATVFVNGIEQEAVT